MAKQISLLIGLLLLLVPAAVRAEDDPLDRWPVDQNNPVGSIPSSKELEEKPMQAGYLLMDLVDLADAAVKAKKYDVAAKDYEAIAQLVPERATAFSKLCEVYVLLDDRLRALDNCRQAMAKPGATVDDAARLARLLSDQDGAVPNPGEIAEANSVISHLREQKVDPVAVAQIQCDVASRLSDEKQLKECTSVLQAKAPNDPATVSYEFALALQQRNYSEGQRLLARAKAAGIKPDGIQKMETAVRSLRFAWLGRIGKILLAIGAFGALLFGAWSLMRRFGSQPAQA
ncbi:MAG TPA: hypothetical protein VGF76_01745 [Polyangiaceae bacterium]|jgi:tetratricopeptide (TPR) repeat protein|nr:hypothetical protein [Polyangiaceae bacterium]